MDSAVRTGERIDISQFGLLEPIRSSRPALERGQPRTIANPHRLYARCAATPVAHSAAHLAHKLFGHVNRKPASIVPTVHNVARMLLARQTGRAVLARAPTASQAQRANKRRPQAGRLALHPANDISRRFRLRANHLTYVSRHTCEQQAEPAQKKRRKPRFHRTILHFATETS